MQEPTYRFVKRLGRFLEFTQGWKINVTGVDHVPAAGQTVMAINHAGYADFIFAAWAPLFETGRYVRFLAKKEVFDSKLTGPIMRGMKHIPVDRTGEPREALDAAIVALQAGEMIAAFPEGSVNRSFVPGRGKTGVVRMVQATGATLLPVAVWGAHRLMTKGRAAHLGRGIAIEVIIGEPFEVDPSEDARQATDRLMEKIRVLLQEAQTRYPQKPESETDGWWLPAHLGGSAPSPDQVVPRQGEAGLA